MSLVHQSVHDRRSTRMWRTPLQPIQAAGQDASPKAARRSICFCARHGHCRLIAPIDFDTCRWHPLKSRQLNILPGALCAASLASKQVFRQSQRGFFASKWQKRPPAVGHVICRAPAAGRPLQVGPFAGRTSETSTTRCPGQGRCIYNIYSVPNALLLL